MCVYVVGVNNGAILYHSDMKCMYVFFIGRLPIYSYSVAYLFTCSIWQTKSKEKQLFYLKKSATYKWCDFILTEKINVKLNLKEKNISTYVSYIHIKLFMSQFFVCVSLKMNFINFERIQMIHLPIL